MAKIDYILSIKYNDGTYGSECRTMSEDELNKFYDEITSGGGKVIGIYDANKL